MNTQKGFSPVLVIAVVAVVALVGVVGWRVYDSSQPAEQATTESATESATTESSVESVDATVKEVDAVVVDDGTADEVSAQLDY